MPQDATRLSLYHSQNMELGAFANTTVVIIIIAIIINAEQQ